MWGKILAAAAIGLNYKVSRNVERERYGGLTKDEYDRWAKENPEQHKIALSKRVEADMDKLLAPEFSEKARALGTQLAEKTKSLLKKDEQMRKEYTGGLNAPSETATALQRLKYQHLYWQRISMNGLQLECANQNMAAGYDAFSNGHFTEAKRTYEHGISMMRDLERTSEELAATASAAFDRLDAIDKRACTAFEEGRINLHSALTDLSGAVLDKITRASEAFNESKFEAAESLFEDALSRLERGEIEINALPPEEPNLAIRDQINNDLAELLARIRRESADQRTQAADS